MRSAASSSRDVLRHGTTGPRPRASVTIEASSRSRPSLNKIMIRIISTVVTDLYATFELILLRNLWAINSRYSQPALLFSSIVCDFLELFYNLWRTVLAKNKIVLDPALRLQSFRTPKTQQLVSEVGLNANNKSDGGPVQTLLEKLTEMNANMGEMKSELTASMNANMGELNNKLTANKEELKSDLKGIGDKLTTMDKKFEEMEGRIESVENKFEDMESKLEAKIFEQVEEVSISFRSDLENLKQKVMTGQGDEFKFQAPYSKPSIKLSTYDGKSSWQVYKTQFSIVADANQWDSQTKACQLAASLRADAADILQTLPETQRLDFDALVNALELRFGEKCVKDYSRLQLKSRQQKVSKRSRTGDGRREAFSLGVF
ncbi:gag-Pol polyprotein [Trichonephila clavipes]|nr:gag-Pol polyprotein [Trichonephila clavipes]